MSDPNKPGTKDPFETAWRAWLDEPARSHPGRAWLEDSLAQKRRSRQRIWYPIAATAALALVLAIGLFWRHREALAPGTRANAKAGAPTLGQGVVLIWLDEQTPLYMTFQPPE